MMKPQQYISPQDHEEITAAIRKAEKKTSGEIFAVIARQSDDYFFVSGFMAAMWALLLGVLFAVGSWYWDYPLTVLNLAISQAAAFAVFIGLFWFFPEFRLHFVPRSIGYRRASSNAVRQFLAHGIHGTHGRSGILIFVSLAEKYAEVVADEGINERVDQSVWDEMVAGLIQHASKDDLANGYLNAIESAGLLLAQEFPPIKGKRNELDDKLIEL